MNFPAHHRVPPQNQEPRSPPLRMKRSGNHSKTPRLSPPQAERLDQLSDESPSLEKLLSSHDATPYDEEDRPRKHAPTNMALCEISIPGCTCFRTFKMEDEKVSDRFLRLCFLAFVAAGIQTHRKLQRLASPLLELWMQISSRTSRNEMIPIALHSSI
jgi:hypothetical protein